MYSMFLTCCGTLKSVDIFEQARIACTQSNWQIPPNQPFQKLIMIVTGQNPDYDGETAYNNLLAHMQQDQDRKNANFILKNLLILDFIVEERVYLSRMGHYNNGQLLSAESQSKSNKTAKSLRDLIASYYVYIKQKSKYYQIQSKQLLSAQTREKYFLNSNSITILNQINICFKIQNLILDINSQYKNGDKNYQLIQFIFKMLLKTYIFCHSIVSIALKVFVGRVLELSKYDLEYIKKFVDYFGKQYRKNFCLFLSLNQSIPCFREINVQDMLMDCEKMVYVIQKQLHYINDDPGVCPEPQQLTPDFLSTLSKQKKIQSENQIQKTNFSEQYQKKLSSNQKDLQEANGILLQNNENLHQNKKVSEENLEIQKSKQNSQVKKDNSQQYQKISQKSQEIQNVKKNSSIKKDISQQYQKISQQKNQQIKNIQKISQVKKDNSQEYQKVLNEEFKKNNNISYQRKESLQKNQNFEKVSQEQDQNLQVEQNALLENQKIQKVEKNSHEIKDSINKNQNTENILQQKHNLQQEKLENKKIEKVPQENKDVLKQSQKVEKVLQENSAYPQKNQKFQQEKHENRKIDKIQQEKKFQKQNQKTKQQKLNYLKGSQKDLPRLVEHSPQIQLSKSLPYNKIEEKSSLLSSQNNEQAKRLAYKLEQVTQKQKIQLQEYFSSYQNFYSSMWETNTQQNVSDLSQQPFMNPRQIYSYYGVPTTEEEQEQSHEEQDGQDEQDEEQEEDHQDHQEQAQQDKAQN